METQNIRIRLKAFDHRVLDQATGDIADTARRIAECIRWLTEVNYQVRFDPELPLAGRVIFPVSPTESNGMEDARFVRFERPDGTVTHYATYTAYDGSNVLPQLVETADFTTFRVATLSGPAARNKGMALFPRQVDGRFVALGRADNENTYVMYSDHVRFWQETARIQVPSRPWELVQIGNCGPPIETSAGWLVITHGVGPLRTYSLGAVLLEPTQERVQRERVGVGEQQQRVRIAVDQRFEHEPLHIGGEQVAGDDGRQLIGRRGAGGNAQRHRPGHRADHLG